MLPIDSNNTQIIYLSSSQLDEFEKSVSSKELEVFLQTLALQESEKVSKPRSATRKDAGTEKMLKDLDFQIEHRQLPLAIQRIVHRGQSDEIPIYAQIFYRMLCCFTKAMQQCPQDLKKMFAELTLTTTFLFSRWNLLDSESTVQEEFNEYENAISFIQTQLRNHRERLSQEIYKEIDLIDATCVELIRTLKNEGVEKQAYRTPQWAIFNTPKEECSLSESVEDVRESMRNLSANFSALFDLFMTDDSGMKEHDSKMYELWQGGRSFWKKYVEKFKAFQKKGVRFDRVIDFYDKTHQMLQPYTISVIDVTQGNFTFGECRKEQSEKLRYDHLLPLLHREGEVDDRYQLYQSLCFHNMMNSIRLGFMDLRQCFFRLCHTQAVEENLVIQPKAISQYLTQLSHITLNLKRAPFSNDLDERIRCQHHFGTSSHSFLYDGILKGIELLKRQISLRKTKNFRGSPTIDLLTNLFWAKYRLRGAVEKVVDETILKVREELKYLQEFEQTAPLKKQRNLEESA